MFKKEYGHMDFKVGAFCLLMLPMTSLATTLECRFPKEGYFDRSATETFIYDSSAKTLLTADGFEYSCSEAPGKITCLHTRNHSSDFAYDSEEDYDYSGFRLNRASLNIEAISKREDRDGNTYFLITREGRCSVVKLQI